MKYLCKSVPTAHCPQLFQCPFSACDWTLDRWWHELQGGKLFSNKNERWKQALNNCAAPWPLAIFTTIVLFLLQVTLKIEFSVPHYVTQILHLLCNPVGTVM